MTVVTTEAGRLRGESDAGVLVFRGVPYAAATVGERRWCRPQKPQPWSGIRDAIAFGPIAPQVIEPAKLERAGLRMSEDCLSLNIWTPDTDDAKRPVLVFVHGGGMSAGSSAQPLYNGAGLAHRGNIVVVTINYRLGALANSFAPEVFGTQGDRATNLAMHDILAALRWTRTNISAFGGDRENITAAGQSSGAIALSCLAVTPAANDAFDKLILQSGGLERVMSEAESRGVTQRFLQALKLPSGADPRELSLERILDAEAQVLANRRIVPPLGEYHPAIDGELPPTHPLKAALAGHSTPVPLLIGATRDEWRAMDAGLDDEYFSFASVRERARLLLGGSGSADEVIALYRADRERLELTSDSRAIASTMVGDFHFRVPSELLALAYAQHGSPTYHYLLEWESPTPGLEACHGMCIPLLFGTMQAVRRLCQDSPETRRQSTLMQDAWIAFARRANPSTPDLGEWPAYTSDKRETMCLGSRPRVSRGARTEIFELWSARFIS